MSSTENKSFPFHVAVSWPVALLPVALTYVALAGMPSPALGQAAPGSNKQGGGLEEIVVTAERRSEKLQRAPLAVTALNARALAQRGVNNLEQLSAYVPSVVIQPTNRPGGGGSSIATYIRGVGTGDYNIPTDPAIGVYIDGVYLARSIGGLLSLPDIAQVEVLEGPQGTLYGRNTLGGAIVINTEPPHLSGPASGLVETHLGTNGRADLIGSVNGALVPDVLSGKLTLATYNYDGYGKDEYNGKDLGNEHRLLARGALRWKLADDLTLDLNADYTRQQQNPPDSSVKQFITGSPLLPLYNAVVAPGLDRALGLPAGSVFGTSFIPSNPYNNYASGPLKDDFESGGVSATLNWTPSPAFQVKSISALRLLDAEIDVDGDQEPYELIGDFTRERDFQASEEIQVSGKLLNDRLNYVAGLYFFSELGHSREDLEIFPGLYTATHAPALELSTLTYQRLFVTNYAAYSQLTYALTDTVDITAGGRINYDQKDYTATEYAPQTGELTVPPTTSSPHWTSFLPKIGLDWKPTRDLLAYVSYSEGFKSGGISPPSGGFPALPYQPEDLRTWELGFKSSWLNHHLTFDADGYYSRYAGIQLTSIVNLPDGSFGKPVLNGGNAHIWGLEETLVAEPVEGVTLNVTGAYTRDRLVSVNPGVAAALGATTGERLADIPDFTLSLGAQYAFDIPYGHLLLRGDYNVIGYRQMTLGDPTSYQTPTSLFNARIAFDPERLPSFEFAVQGTNLTNKLYYTYDQSQTVTDEHLVEPADGREVYFSARYRF